MSGAQATFQATITARDESSAVLARIAENTGLLAKKLGALPSAPRPAAMAGFWGSMTAGARQTTAAVSVLEGKMTGMFGGVGRALPVLGGLTGGVTLGGIFTLTEGVAKSSVMFQRQADSLKMATADLAKFGFLARMTDTDIDSLGAGMGKFSQSIGGAVTGKNKEALGMFRALHINLKDAKGNLRGTSDLLGDMFKAFEVNPDPRVQSTIIKTLFGRGGEALKPLFRLSGEARDRFLKDFQSMTFSPSEQQKADLAAYHESWLKIDYTVSQVRKQIGTDLAPVLGPALDEMSQFLSDNREAIGQFARANVQGFANWMRQVDWRGNAESARDFARGAGEVIDSLGGVKRILEGLAIYKGATWAAGIVAGLDSIATAAGLASGALNPALAAMAGMAAMWHFMPHQNIAAPQEFSQGLQRDSHGNLQPVGGDPTGYMKKALEDSRLRREQAERDWREEMHDAEAAHQAGARVKLPPFAYNPGWNGVGLGLTRPEPGPDYSREPLNPNPGFYLHRAPVGNADLFPGVAASPTGYPAQPGQPPQGEVVVRVEAAPGVAAAAAVSPGSQGVTVERAPDSTGPSMRDYHRDH